MITVTITGIEWETEKYVDCTYLHVGKYPGILAEAELRGRVDRDVGDVPVVVHQITRVLTSDVGVQGRKLVNFRVSVSFRFST